MKKKIILLILIIIFIITLISLILDQTLKNIFIDGIIINFLKITTIKIVVAFFLLIFISVLLIIIYIMILRILNIMFLSISDYVSSLFIKSQLQKEKIWNQKSKHNNITIKNKINLSLGYYLILILMITILFLLYIEAISLVYFFLDSLSAHIFYIFISLLYLYQVKLILKFIFLPIKFYLNNVLIFIKKVWLIISPFFSIIYLYYFFIRKINYLYVKIIFVLEKIDYYIFYLKKMSIINWICILIAAIFFLLFLNFICNNKTIKKTFMKFNTQISKYFNNFYCSKKIKHGFILKSFNLATLFNTNIYNNFRFKWPNFLKTTDIIKSKNSINNFSLIKNFISFIFKFNFLIDIKWNNLFNINLEFFKLTEDNNSNDSDSDNDIIAPINLPSNFENFNNILSIERNNYINLKMIKKGIDPNEPLTDWFASSALKNTNGSQSEVDSFIEKNLNIIIKNQREAQLNTHAFERFKPFLIHRMNNNPNSFPSIIPISNTFSEYEAQELTDAINKENDIKNIKEDKNSDTALSSDKFYK